MTSVTVIHEAFVDQPAFFPTATPTPLSGVFLGTCVTALHRGVALGDLIDAIIDAPLSGPWVTWSELNEWVEIVSELEARADIPDAAWLDYCAANRIDPVTGAAIVLASVIDEVVVS